MDKIRVFLFLQYQGTFFDFQKRAGRPSPLKQSHECSIKKCILKNLSKFTGKHHLGLRVSFLKKFKCIYNFFLIKEIPVEVFSCQLSKIFKNIFFQNPSGQLILNFSNENKASEDKILINGFEIILHSKKFQKT